MIQNIFSISKNNGLNTVKNWKSFHINKNLLSMRLFDDPSLIFFGIDSSLAKVMG